MVVKQILDAKQFADTNLPSILFSSFAKCFGVKKCNFFFNDTHSGFFLGFFFSDLGGDAKKPPKKIFFSQVQAGFPLIFMEKFSKTVKICPKRGL